MFKVIGKGLLKMWAVCFCTNLIIFVLCIIMFKLAMPHYILLINLNTLFWSVTIGLETQKKLQVYRNEEENKKTNKTEEQ